MVPSAHGHAMPDATVYDLFVSYSRWDNRHGRVAEFLDLIQKEHLAVSISALGWRGWVIGSNGTENSL